MAGKGASNIRPLIMEDSNGYVTINAKGFGIGKTATAVTGSYAITNWTSDVAMDCDTAAAAEIADVLGTLINHLIAKGIITGTVSA